MRAKSVFFVLLFVIFSIFVYREFQSNNNVLAQYSCPGKDCGYSQGVWCGSCGDGQRCDNGTCINDPGGGGPPATPTPTPVGCCGLGSGYHYTACWNGSNSYCTNSPCSSDASQCNGNGGCIWQSGSCQKRNPPQNGWGAFNCREFDTEPQNCVAGSTSRTVGGNTYSIAENGPNGGCYWDNDPLSDNCSPCEDRADLTAIVVKPNGTIKTNNTGTPLDINISDLNGGQVDAELKDSITGNTIDSCWKDDNSAQSCIDLKLKKNGNLKDTLYDSAYPDPDGYDFSSYGSWSLTAHLPKSYLGGVKYCAVSRIINITVLTPTPTPTSPPIPTSTLIPTPTLDRPSCSCGAYNSGTGTTPVTYSWSNGNGLQVWDSTPKWWFNDWSSSPKTISSDPFGNPGIPPGRVVSGMTTYDFITFSPTCQITCPIPTPTFTPTPTPTPTPLPTIPAPTGICSNYNPTDHSFSITWNWQSMISAINYWLQSNSAVQWFVNTWVGNTTSYIISNVPADTTTYGRVAWTNDPTYTNVSNFSADGSVICPLPTPYPTVAIYGNLKEDLGLTCANNISTNSISIGINPQSAPGVTPVCGITPPAGSTKSTYRCTVIFDNQNANPTPAQTLILNASTSDYDSANWSNPGSCTATGNSLNVDVAAPVPTTVFNKDIAFKFNSSWFKLKDASFSKNATDSNLNNKIPLNISSFDTDDSTVNRNFDIGEAGVITANNDVSAGLGTAPISTNGWKADGYNKNTIFTPSSYVSYVKSRKAYKTITGLSDSDFDQNQINIKEGDLTISGSDITNYISGKKIVLVVTGTVNLNVELNDTNANPATTSFVVIADTIKINYTVKALNGIFIGNTIDLSANGANTNELKVKGNLIAGTLTNLRQRADNSKPSLFVVFYPKMYLDLIKYLSTSTYDWRQLQ